MKTGRLAFSVGRTVEERFAESTHFLVGKERERELTLKANNRHFVCDLAGGL